MICKNIPLWGEDDKAYLSTYILYDSSDLDPGKRRPAMLVIPGGGYLGTSDREAEFVALAFAAKGYHAFVLRYHVEEEARMPQPILDGFKAVSIIRAHADAWCVDPDKIAAVGFSAGGHLASALATMWKDETFARQLGLDREAFRIQAAILSYPCTMLHEPIPPVHTGLAASEFERFRDGMKGLMRNTVYVESGEVRWDIGTTMSKCITGKADPQPEDLMPYSTALLVDEDTAPCFVWTTNTDEMVPASNSLLFVKAMMEKGCQVEFHLFADGPHGISLGTMETAGEAKMLRADVGVWFDMALTWLDKTLHIGERTNITPAALGKVL